ncbi:MAG: hypothetical protein FWC73_10610 [Defluviitaleaceae bacterium]|nr:hypothetical protein [Defluviitaleaceae bacterium]
MHPLLILVLVIIGISVAISIGSNISTKRRRLQSLGANFGKPPEDDGSLHIESAARYDQHIQAHEPTEQWVDSITWNDLDMDKVFARINACQSSVGEEYLYHILHQLPLNSEALDKRENLIHFFNANPDIRLSVQGLLANRLGKENFNGLTALMFAPSSKLLKHRHIYTALALLPFAMGLVIILHLSIGILGVLASFVINMFVHYKTKQHIAVELPTIKYLTSMLRCCKALTKNKKLEGLPFMDEINKYYQNLKSIRRNIPGSTSMGGDMAESFLEYFNIMFLSDIRNYNKFIRIIKKHHQEFHAMYRAVGEIDVSISVLSFRHSLPVYSQPVFQSAAAMELTDIYHPLIADPVTNSAKIDNDSLLTGSNASGKSTFIKALAINGILAQTINTCAAASFKTRFSLVMTSMVVRDDLSAGDSYFIVEIKSLRRILEQVRKFPCTCYIDEILRGTNTIERIAASASVLEYLHKEDALCIAASHDIELTRILAEQYDNYHFRETVTDEGVHFNYKINNGPSTTRNAIKLLQFMDFPMEIVAQAEGLAEEIYNA